MLPLLRKRKFCMMYDFKRGTACKPALISVTLVTQMTLKILDLNPLAEGNDRYLLCGISSIGNHIHRCVF